MGKTGRWIRKLLTGKKVNSGAKDLASEKEIAATNDALTVHSDNGVGGYDHHHHHHRPTTPISTTQPTTPREKRRWSFRRSSAAPASRQDQSPAGDDQHQPGSDSKNHAAAADAALAAAKAAAAVIQLTAGGEYGRGSAVEEAAAVRIQSVFRSYLARKALNALKGLVKLQALVRGHLVRKQATATLRCMQALVSVQSRALAQRLKMAEQIKHIDQSPSNSNHRKSTQDHQQRFRNSNQDLVEENIKIVEMDLGDYNKPVSKPRISNYSNQTDHNHRLSTQLRTPTKHENSNNQYFQTISPSPSAITDTSPRTCSNHFDEYNSFNNNNNNTAQSSPKCGYYSKPDHPRNIIPSPYSRSEYAESLYSEYYPGYMANTESSRAKARSHSAPKQRPPVETAAVMERQPSINKRRPSLEGRNVPRAVRMQRSSSQVGATAAAQGYHYPWSVKLDRSAVSLKDSECGSTSTVLTNANYCRSLVGFEVQRGRY